MLAKADMARGNSNGAKKFEKNVGRAILQGQGLGTALSELWELLWSLRKRVKDQSKAAMSQVSSG